MKIITDEKKVSRNKKIGTITTIGSLVILGVGLYMSFKPELMNYSFGALLLGFLLSQVGIYFGSRWGRSPRPDEVISQSLKGLGDQFTLYHYSSPVPHLLVGPAGTWILAPFYQGGTITYDEKRKRYKQKGGNFYLKLFGQESLGRPELELSNYRRDLERYFEKHLPEGVDKPTIDAAMIFTNPKAEINVVNSPDPAMAPQKLKDFLRKKSKEKNLSEEKIKVITSALER